MAIPSNTIDLANFKRGEALPEITSSKTPTFGLDVFKREDVFPAGEGQAPQTFALSASQSSTASITTAVFRQTAKALTVTQPSSATLSTVYTAESASITTDLAHFKREDVLPEIASKYNSYGLDYFKRGEAFPAAEGTVPTFELLSASQASAASISTTIIPVRTQTLTTTQSSSATLVATQVITYLKALTVTQPQTPSYVRAVSKSLTLTQPQSSTLTRGLILHVALSAAVSEVVNLAVYKFHTTVLTASLVVTTIASMLRNLHIFGSTGDGNQASINVTASGVLNVPAVVAPPSIPANWFAQLTSPLNTNANTMNVLPLTVSLPYGSRLYFANGVQIVIGIPGNLRDTTVSIIPVHPSIASGQAGTGIDPAAYTATAATTASTSATSIVIAPNVQYMASGSTLYFRTGSGTVAAVLTASVPSGATTISVSPISATIPSGSVASGTSPGDTTTYPDGPGTGVPPAPPPRSTAKINLKRVSLRYPIPTLDGKGFPVNS